MAEPIYGKLDYLDETKQLIKQAIRSKGVDVTDADAFRSYPDKIQEIQVGISQNMPIYSIEQDEEGNLWLVNNYPEIIHIPYELNDKGEFIVLQDDIDSAKYEINKYNELEVSF